MTQNFVRLISAACFGLTAAACSPVSPDRIVTAADTSSYETFFSTADATSTLSGTALLRRPALDRTDLARTSGSLTHNTGETELDDGTYTLSDADGFSAGGALSDGTSTLLTGAAQGFARRYSYARAYTQSYAVGGTDYDVQGVIGIATLEADMPTSGRATWTGEATGTFTTPNETANLTNGTASVTAAFGAGRISARLSGFDAQDATTGRRTSTGFNAVEVNGMQISGATDEVGGTAHLRGTDGAVSVLFLAD